jgi:hypothetical protein
MTLRKFTFEGGTNGANIATTGAATGDTNWGLVNKGTGSTAVYSSTSPMHGSLCGLLTPGSGAACELRWNDWTTATSLTASWYVNWSSAPADNEEFFRVAYGSGSRVLSGILAASSKISLQNAAATIFWTSTAGLSSATWYRFEAYAKYGASTTTGEAEFAYYLGDSATPVQAMTRVTNQNMGTAAITGLYIGKTAGAGTSTAPFSLDSVQANDNGTTFIGPYVPAGNAAPVAVAGAVQNVTTSTATLTATATDDVSIASFACTLLDSSGVTSPSIGTGTVTGAGTPSASVSFPITGLVAGVHRFNITATDGGSPALTSATVIGQINYTSTAPVYRSVTAATYTVIGGGTALAAIQAATPSTRYLNSSAPPGGGTGSIAYQPLSPSPVPVPFSVQARASDAVTPVSITVYLKMGGTVIATRGPFTLTTTDASYGGTTNTTGETAAITVRSALTTDWSCT